MFHLKLLQPELTLDLCCVSWSDLVRLPSLLLHKSVQGAYSDVARCDISITWTQRGISLKSSRNGKERHQQFSVKVEFLRSCVQLSHSPAAAAVPAVLAGSLADWESVSLSPHTSSSAPPPCVFPPPDSVAPAVTAMAGSEARARLSPNF